MDIADLVRMANQITAYFEPYPKTEAVDGIAKHIHLFWDPRMRNALKRHLDSGGEGLSPLFIEAMADYYKGPKTPPDKSRGPDKKPKKTAEPVGESGTGPLEGTTAPARKSVGSP